MELPKNASEAIAAFEGLAEERVKQIVEHLASIPDSRGPAVIKQIRENGGFEADFINAIFGKPVTPTAPAPAQESQ